MIIKRINKAPLIFSVEDHRRAAQFAALLFAVGRRVGKPRKSKSKTTKKGEWVRENICEPYFFRGISKMSLLFSFAEFQGIFKQGIFKQGIWGNSLFSHC